MKTPGWKSDADSAGSMSTAIPPSAMFFTGKIRSVSTGEYASVACISLGIENLGAEHLAFIPLERKARSRSLTVCASF
jgi:hypothetical protein